MKLFDSKQLEYFDGKFVNPRRPKIEEVVDKTLTLASNQISRNIDVRLKGLDETAEKTRLDIQTSMGLCIDAINHGLGYCAKKGHDAYKEGQKTKRQSLELKAKSIETAKKDNEQAQEEKDAKNKQLEKINNRSKKRDQEIKEIKEKLENPDISKEEKENLEAQLAVLI
ncbi:hypothetical protein C1645_842504, partial [Glomus cerebriforme]